MSWLLSYLLVYITGGVTFIPLLTFLIWYCSKTVPTSEEGQHKVKMAHRELKSQKKGNPNGYSEFKVNEFQYRSDLNVDTVFSGWLTVTDEHYKLPQVHPDHYKSSATFSGSAKMADSGTNENGFIKMVRDIGSQDSGEGSNDTPSDIDSKQLKQVRKKNRFYAVLKHGNLFLYPDASEKNVQHVIVMNNYFVSIWPHNVTEGRLFTKSTSICLLKRSIGKHMDDGSIIEKPFTEKELIYLFQHSGSNTVVPAGTYFLYADTNVKKEDWYFALLRATSLAQADQNDPEDLLNPRVSAKPLFFNTADMIDLIQTINSTESQVTTMWINAIAGRLFLSVYQTAQFKAFIRMKLEEKLQKIRTPGFLDELQVGHIDVGHSAPFITSPKLKQLLPDGTLVVSFIADYSGEMCVEISTKVVLNLGSHFKEREIDVNLRVTLKRLYGPMKVYVKPPPSDRLWYCYESMPKMDLDIEPVVSSRSVNYNVITNMIEKKFREAIQSSLVYPFMDDFVFFRPTDEIFRGGIWDPSPVKRIKRHDHKQVQDQNTENKINEGNNEDRVSVFESVEDERVDDASSARLKFPSTLRNTRRITPKTSSSSFSVLNVSPRRLSSISTAEYNGSQEEKSDLSIAATQIKNGVSNSVSKFKSWYSKKTSGSSYSTNEVKLAPQMISNRRKRGSSASSSPSIKSKAFERQFGAYPPSSPGISRPEMFISERMRTGRQMNADSSYSGQQTQGVSTAVEQIKDESLNRRLPSLPSDSSESVESEGIHDSTEEENQEKNYSVEEDQQDNVEQTSSTSTSKSSTTSKSSELNNVESLLSGKESVRSDIPKSPAENGNAKVIQDDSKTAVEAASNPPELPVRTRTLSRKPPPQLPPRSN